MVIANYENIDFSYKDTTLKTTYDIESTPNLFTLAMIHDKALTLILFGDSQFDDLEESDLRSQLVKFASKKTNMKLLGINDPSELHYYIKHYKQGNREDMMMLMSDMQQMQMCMPLNTDAKYGETFAEYHGWNSSRYDLTMIVCVKMLAQDLKERLTPQIIRLISNAIVKFNDADYLFPKHLQEFTGGLIDANRFKYELNLAIWFDGHIDWAAVARQTDSEEESLYPPGLKSELAKWGLDIIIDESVGDNNEKVWTDEEKNDLVEYNFNDVLGTRQVSRNKVLQGFMISRDLVRKMYPYTSARATDMSQLGKYTPSARDTSAANLASLVLIGPDRAKPIDWETVRYSFPVPDGDTGNFKTVDLLEYMKQNEPFMPDDMYTFFDHFRNKDTRSKKDYKECKLSQPVTHSATMNIPYYRNGKPTDAVITLSCGGAHGFHKVGLSKMSEEEIKTWTRSKLGASKLDGPTVDIRDVIHIDWSSFYPVMTSKMQLYIGSDGIDRMDEIYQRRMVIKHVIESNPDRSKWGEELWNMNEEQMGFKFVMNNATGAGNQHKKYALLPVDNKTLSMRLIGNMHIWCLAQRLTNAGAFVLSTNTDGIYICNITFDKAKEIIDGYVRVYGMGVEPEIVERFINRDASNRIEYVNGHRNAVSGRLRWGNHLTYNDDSIGRLAVYPLASCHAALEYINQDDWLEKPYDPTFIRNLLEKIRDDESSPLDAWYYIHKAKASRLTLDGKLLQHVNRLVLVKEGGVLGTLSSANPKRSDATKIFVDSRHGIPLEEIMLKKDKIAITEEEYLANHEIDKSHEYDKVITQTKTSTKTKYYKYPLVKAEFADYSHLDTSKQIKALKKTVDSADNETFVPIDEDLTNPTEAYYATISKAMGANYVGFPLKKDPTKYAPIKLMRYGEKVTGFTSQICKVLNMTDDLNNFDRQELDIEAYAKWAEDLLSGWKITCDFEEIGMKKADDTVVQTVTKAKRLSKRDLALNAIESTYDMSLGVLAESA